MEKQRNSKILSIIALVVAIVGMSLGFAAFSTTLNISSSATVTPSSGSFYLGFYPSQIPTLDDGIVSPTTSGGAAGSSVTLSPGSTTLTGLKADFTEPGQTTEYSFYVGNESAYDAYLTAINFLNVSGKSSNKVCTPGTGTTASLVQATCEAITMTVEVNGITATSTKTSITGASLVKGSYTPVKVTIRYDENGARADGPFTVEFGGISIDYSTSGTALELIHFRVGTYECTAERGMTWSDYVNSEYYSAIPNLAYLCSDYDEKLPNNTVLIDGYNYTYNCPM